MSLVENLFVAGGEATTSSPEQEKDFFDCLRLKNGVYKTTYPHRMDDFNARLANYLPASRPLRVLDVGISSGVSTLEWAETLEGSGIDYQMTGIDLTLRGLLLSFGDRLHAVLDSTKWPMLFEIERAVDIEPSAKTPPSSPPLLAGPHQLRALVVGEATPGIGD